MRIGLVGCSGKMGTLIKTLLQAKSDYIIGPGFSRNSAHPLAFVIENNDILMDFSSSELMEELLIALLSNPKPLILGTTLPSQSSAVNEQIQSLSRHVPVVVCSNTSLGSYMQKRLATLLAKVFDDSYDIRIREVHHRGKKDPVSGTAQDLVATICRAKQEEWQQEYSVGTNCKNVRNIELHASRVGSVPGDHEVAFINDKEQILIRHTVFSREVFAEGALRILDWLIKESPPPGYYGTEAGLKVSV
ncbi:4-hydroxy-tetrahydrodipicolinate reductase [Chlamydia vaughanii]|uniref:4-hydroxy-tetrahydrodipicolinate reductase n=1 Tax=Chlamydia vaughanii TaxID=3112552 RepID=UPI0032B2A285